MLAFRYQNLKVHFMIQEATGIDVWRHPFTTLRAPIFFDLAIDPGERGQEGMNYKDWWYRRSYIAVPVQNIVPAAMSLHFTSNATFDIGTDLDSPVSPDYYDQAPFAFSGTVGRTKITYTKK